MEKEKNSSSPERSPKFREIMGDIPKSLTRSGYIITLAILIALGITMWIMYHNAR